MAAVQKADRVLDEQGLSIREVSRDLGVSDTVIRNWKRKLAEEGEQAFPASRQSAESDSSK